MTVAAVAVAALLIAACAMALVRIIRGPTTLDRIVATDVLLAITATAIIAEAAFTRDPTALPVVVVVSLLGITGSVGVARFVTREKP
ncbi:monovalent cation/H+ antiporter complex subunit F [Glycomyces harbinensis]|jgi:multicomponent Na+:H+ antiporter subunit F|uniref:Multicomponent Na+:H+ antiporter subunit F n=1 Tax=Glycomyces harbinensis TaxID=58114 RepID=A0A1G6XXR6_9ACTN|nr:monovalent cation/H+ antiporter complex subunit F [Glycomyces harbinensis]SDD83014.1 multicomponent Na+:H+ antiporter subunit F [Glycomyces harbinensis]